MQIPYYDRYFFAKSETKKFFSNGLLMDTGPLYLYLVGKFAPTKLEKMGYTLEDYEYLTNFMDGLPFRRIVITPHIFHEFYKHVQKAFPQDYIGIFGKMKDLLLKMEEIPVSKDSILRCDYFKLFEIGEHSLYLAYNQSPSAILTDELRSAIWKELKDDNTTLVMNFRKDVMSYILTYLV